MRRAEREIVDPAVIDEIMQRATVCHIALCDGTEPYVVPMSFGYADRALYLHCAREGRKLDLLQRNPQVCFAAHVDESLIRGERPCNWSLRYRSVVGTGIGTVLTDPIEKSKGLDEIMAHYGGDPGPVYPPEALDSVCVLRIAVDSITGKQSGAEGAPLSPTTSA